MTDNVLARLVPEGVDDYELLYLLEQHYGSGVRWKDGRAIQIERGPAGFSAEECDALRNKIRATLIDSPGEAIRTAVLFSHVRRVSGYFRTADLQILPASPEAPRPAETAAHHPFYLQFKLRRSIDGFVTNIRGARFLMEMAWLLNALLRTSVTCHGPRARKLWVLCEPPDGSLPWHAHWCQEGYWDPGLPGDRDDFTHADVPPILIIAGAEYYGADYLPIRDQIVLPVGLHQMLAAVNRLDHADRRRFIRAARWLSAANELWEYHVSSWYVALVAAIESLATDDEPPRCTTCGQVRGVTQRFREFVEQYVQDDETNKSWLYKVRSQLVHGKFLFNIDEAPWTGLAVSPNYLDQREAFMGMSRIAKLVVVGWLRSKG